MPDTVLGAGALGGSSDEGEREGETATETVITSWVISA